MNIKNKKFHEIKGNNLQNMVLKKTKRETPKSLFKPCHTENKSNTNSIEYSNEKVIFKFYYSQRHQIIPVKI